MSNETPPFRDHPAVRAVIGFGRAPDAVDAAIERHRAAREELQRATGGVDAASNADGAAWADLLATRPGDVPGAVRLLRYVSGSPASEVVEDPQDLLRQLLAAVEAGETGGTAREGAPPGGEAPAIGGPDPALAVVAEFRTDWDTLGHAIDAAGTDEVAPAIVEAEGEAYERLKAVRPTTPEGFRALAGAWAIVLGGERMGEPGIMHADHAADSLIAGAGVCLSGSTDAPVSPALAEMIARHRDLVRQSDARGLSDAVADPLFDEAWSVFRQACSFPIAGPADLAAKVDLMAAEITEGIERGETDTAAHAWNCLRADLLRPGALDGLCADSAAFVEHVDHDASSRDPVHALIETHRAAYAEWDRLAKAYDGIVPGEAGRDAVGVDERASGQRERAAYDALFQAQPKTPAGVLGLAEYLGEAVAKVTTHVGPTDGDRAMATIAASLRALTKVDASAADPRLCALVAAWEGAERAACAPGLPDEEVASLTERANELLRSVYAFPARTMVDLCAKLPVFRDEAASTGAKPDVSDADLTLEACALRGLVADLERLTEAGSVSAIGEPVTATGPDPVLTAIAASRRAEAEMAALQGAPRGDQPKAWTARENALCKVQQAAREAVWRTVPTTRAGRRALIEYARFQVEVHAGETGIIDNAKALFDEILAPIAAAVDAERPEALSCLGGDDPAAAALVSAIEAEWSIWASLDGRERDEAGDRAFDASIARRDALLDAAEALPASSREARHAKALARAWMDWVEDERPNAPRGAYDFDGRLVFDIHASFMACERPAVSSDAETLVERILATWVALASAEDASDDAASEVLLEQRAALLREAERLPATRPHLVAKALAFAWIGHAHLWQVGQAREDYGIDGRLALDIEATARVPAAPGIGPNAEPEHELSALTVSQLARLYGALEPFEDLLGRAENAPCFWRGDGTERSPDGEIIRQEADRLGQLVRAIADEMKRRVPANGDERIDRLNVLVRRAAMLDGLNTDRVLLTEALAACEA